MNINAEEQKGEQSLKGLLDLTKPKKEDPYKKAQEEILKEVFK